MTRLSPPPAPDEYGDDDTADAWESGWAAGYDAALKAHNIVAPISNANKSLKNDDYFDRFDLMKWQDDMDLTQREAANLLGVSLSTYRDKISGFCRTTGKPSRIKLTMALACERLKIMEDRRRGRIMRSRLAMQKNK